MKKAILTLALLLAICTVCVAQQQKVTVGKDGEMIVNGDTVAYIEKTRNVGRTSHRPSSYSSRAWV